MLGDEIVQTGESSASQLSSQVRENNLTNNIKHPKNLFFILATNNIASTTITRQWFG